MEQILKEPILQNLLSTIPPKDHIPTIRQLLLIGVNMVSGAIHGNRLKNGSKKQYDYELINQENQPRNQNSQYQYRDVLDQINKIKSKINHIANYITGTQENFNHQQEYDGNDSRGNDNRKDRNKGKNNKGNDNREYENRENNNRGNDNRGNGNKGSNSRGNNNTGNDQKKQSSYPNDSRQSSNKKGSNQQHQQNKKNKMRGNFVADGQSLQQINMIDGNKVMIPTKDKASVTPKITQTVINIPKTSSNQHDDRKPNGRRHLDDTQLKSIMAYPQSPLNKKHKQDKNKNKNQSMALNYNYQQPQLSHTYSNNRSRKVNQYQNNDIERPIHTGNPNPIKSKIKSLVDRDKQRYYYNNSPNNKRDVQVEIYQIPERTRNQQNMRNDKDYQDKDHQDKDEEYSSYRFDEDQHQEQQSSPKAKPNKQQSSPKAKQQKPREKDTNDQSKTATFKKPKAKETIPPKSPQHTKPERNVPQTEEQPQDGIDGQSLSSSFSQFSLGSTGRRQIGKISRRGDRQE